MADLVEIAEYILAEVGPMSVMKLQKLVYYSHAWSLVWDGQPMYDARVEAWANGPVVPELHELHRDRFRVYPGSLYLAREAQDARITITVSPGGGFIWNVPDLMFGGDHTGVTATITEAADAGRACLIRLREEGENQLRRMAEHARARGEWAESTPSPMSA